MTRFQKILIGLGAVVVVGAIVAVSVFSKSEAKGEEVYMAKAGIKDVVSSVSASGRIEARTKVNVQSSVIGEIVDLPVKEGDSVKKGDLLVQIDPERYRSEVDRLQAILRMQRIQLRDAEVRLADARRRLARASDLYDGSGLVSKETLEQSELQVATGEIGLESLREQITQAEANLAKARDELAKTTLRSPIAGTVTQLNAEKGEITLTGTMNNPGTIILIVSDMSEILAEVDVDETRVVQVTPGQRARVVVDAIGETKPYMGSVDEIAGTATQRPGEQVRVFPVKVVLDEVDAKLRPGMTAKAKITTEGADGALTVPIQAVLLRPASEIEKALEKKDETKEAEPEPEPEAGEEKTEAPVEATEKKEKPDSEEREVVFLVKDGKVVLTPVKTGISDDTSVVILEGLSEGDTVVTGPYRTVKALKHGDPVKEKEEPSPSKQDDEGDSAVQVEVD